MNTQARFVSPPGYGPVAPLDKVRHAGLGIAPGGNYRWCAELNAMMISAAEFGRAAMDYPIAFARESAGEYLPLAVLGLRNQENLFVDAEGRWLANHYLPAYARRHPFCTTNLQRADGSITQNMICVQEDRLAASTTPYFDSKGEPTAAWEPVSRLLELYEGARAETRIFMGRLARFDLIVPFDAVALPRIGQQMRLNGLFRIDERRLDGLADSDLAALQKSGELRAIYTHLLSLENFSRLLDLSLERQPGASATAQ